MSVNGGSGFELIYFEIQIPNEKYIIVEGNRR